MTNLDYRSVEAALAGCRWNHTIFTYERIGSTMDRARELAHKGAPEGTLVIAAEQTEGRGRLARAWLSPVGSLSLSILVYPSAMQMPYLTMLTGLAVAEAIEQVAVVKADLKWPNDVQIQGRKVAGILVESGVARSKTFAVIGIGLNVNLAITSCPDIAAIATSLSDETGHPIDAMAVLRAQVSAIETMYLDVSPDIIFERWQKRLVTIGSRVRAAGINTAIKGLATGVTKEGSLVVRSEEGIEHIIIAGDVTLRQP